jgi:hypothetical protein
MDFPAGRIQCQIHDLVDLLLRDRLLSTPDPAHLRELDQPVLGEPSAPPAAEAGDTDNARARTTSRCGADDERATDSRTSR